ADPVAGRGLGQGIAAVDRAAPFARAGIAHERGRVARWRRHLVGALAGASARARVADLTVAAGAAAVVETLGLARGWVARLAGPEVAAAVRRADALVVDADERRSAVAAAGLVTAVRIAG